MQNVLKRKNKQTYFLTFLQGYPLKTYFHKIFIVGGFLPSLITNAIPNKYSFYFAFVVYPEKKKNNAPTQSAKGTVLYFFFISPYFYNCNKYPSDEKILFLQPAESNVFFGLKQIEKTFCATRTFVYFLCSTQLY